MTLGDAAQINPRVPLRAGVDAPFIAMADVRADLGGVQRWTKRTFSGGGARFQAGDVLVARITPCLENGKVARVPEHFGPESGHGSTEFLVVRGRPGVSDTGFLHHLLRSTAFFTYAVPKMTGTSGRQRLPVDQLAQMPIVLPPRREQERLAGLLDNIDRSIEAHRSAGVAARQLLDALWTRACITTRDACKVGEFATLDKGVSYKGQFLGDGDPLINLANFGVHGSFNRAGLKRYGGPVRVQQTVKAGELIMANTDLTQRRDVLARPALVPEDLCDVPFTHHTYAVRCESVDRPWLYATMRSDRFHTHAISYSTGSTVAALPRDAVLDYPMPWPAAVERARFNVQAMPLLRLDEHTALSAERLAAVRRRLADLLLSGELNLTIINPSNGVAE